MSVYRNAVLQELLCKSTRSPQSVVLVDTTGSDAPWVTVYSVRCGTGGGLSFTIEFADSVEAPVITLSEISTWWGSEGQGTLQYPLDSPTAIVRNTRYPGDINKGTGWYSLLGAVIFPVKAQAAVTVLEQFLSHDPVLVEVPSDSAAA